jgi:osmotically-inducible protein OsmY
MRSETQIPPEDTANAAYVCETVADRGLAVAVRKALDEIGYWPVRNLAVHVDAGSVTLRGIVPSYHLKQLAQSATKGVAGVVHIINSVEVVNGR